MTARQTWVALETSFVQASATSRLSILNSIMHYTFEPESTVLSHTNRLRALCDQLEEAGTIMDSDQLILHLLNSMPEEYEQQLPANFLRMQPPSTLTMEYVCNALMAAETTLATKGRKTASAYVAQSYGSGGGGRFPSRPGFAGGSPNRGAVCSLCNKTGHTREKCFQKVGYPEWWGNRPRVGKSAPRPQKGGLNYKSKKRPDPPSPAGSDDDANDASSDDEASKRKAKTDERWKRDQLPYDSGLTSSC